MKKLAIVIIVISLVLISKFIYQQTWLSTKPVPYRTAQFAAKTAEEHILLGRKIDINSASVKDLMVLQGIGPKIAGKIIEARPFDSVDDLVEINGIGPGKLAKIRHYIDAK